MYVRFTHWLYVRTVRISEAITKDEDAGFETVNQAIEMLTEHLPTVIGVGGAH